MTTRRTFLAGAGAALFAAPGIARAQQAGRVNRIAIASPSDSAADMVEGGPSNFSAFLQEMRRLGQVEGRNLIVQRHSGQGRGDPYESLAREVVESRPDLIVARSSPLVAAVKALTTTIPIVATFADPVASGLVASLARPGSNITGFSTDSGPETNGKVMQLLKAAVPATLRLAYLDVRAMWELPSAAAVRVGAQRLGLVLVPVLLDHPVREESYRDAFVGIARERVDALYAGAAAENRSNFSLIAELALAARLPAAYSDPRFAQVGGLMSYGPDLLVSFRGMAGYVDRILKGAKPADLPVQLPKEFEFVINLKTAKAIGIEIPYQVLAVATEVIE